jgi:hypothetical protein
MVKRKGTVWKHWTIITEVENNEENSNIKKKHILLYVVIIVPKLLNKALLNECKLILIVVQKLQIMQKYYQNNLLKY